MIHVIERLKTYTISMNYASPNSEFTQSCLRRFDKRSTHDACAIITTYRPGANLFQLIADIAQQVGHIFLINDSGSQEIRIQLDTKLSQTNHISIVHLSRNSGIACALNHGLRMAAQRGYRNALLLDDDTRVSPTLVLALSEAWRELTRLGHKPGTIGVARYDDCSPSKLDGAVEPLTAWRSVRTVITAGSMLDLDIAARIGGFREEFFIDAVDYEYCARLRRNGYLVIRLERPHIRQPVGAETTARVLGFRISTSNHTPQRRYYMFRNYLVFAGEQMRTDPLLCLAILYFLTKTVLKVIVFEQERARKLRAISYGILHGIRRKLGRIAPGIDRLRES